MPEFVIPAEADHCVYCGKVLTAPPCCCTKMLRKRNQTGTAGLTRYMVDKTSGLGGEAMVRKII